MYLSHHKKDEKEIQVIDENFYSSFHDTITAFSESLKAIQIDLEGCGIDDDSTILDYIVKCIRKILSSPYKNLIQSLRESLTKISNKIDKIENDQLKILVYRLIRKISAFNRYCLKMSIHTGVDGNNGIENEVDYGILPGTEIEWRCTKQCRICEQLVDVNNLSDHLKICYEAASKQQVLNRVDKEIRKLQKECGKNLEARWPGPKDSITRFELPLLHIIFQLDVLFNIDLSVEQLKEVTNAIIDNIVQISSLPLVGNNNIISGICETAIDLVGQKKMQFLQVIEFTNRARFTTLSATSSFSNAPLASMISDFEFLNQISFGKFAKVYLARKRSTQDTYAIKAISKKTIMEKTLLRQTLFEKDVLRNVKSDYIIKFYYSINGKNNCYIVMEYLPGGDLKSLLNNIGCVSESQAKFYIAEIVEALSYLRTNGIIHRDLKPDNILITGSGHLKLADFGLSEKGLENRSPQVKKANLCGTPGYTAPEVVMGDAHLFVSDYWSLGIILFELIYGEPPFNGNDEEETFMKTVSKSTPLELLDSCVSDECKDLIDKLLKKNPKERIGLNGISEIKDHKWFDDIEWSQLHCMETPFQPELSSKLDVSFFEDKGTIRDEFVLDPEKEADILEDIQCAKEIKRSRGSFSSLCSIFSGEDDYSVELDDFPATNIDALKAIPEENNDNKKNKSSKSSKLSRVPQIPVKNI